MKGKLLLVGLMMFGFTLSGCLEPVIPCYMGDDTPCLALDRVCNEAVTVYDQCHVWLESLPGYGHMPDICAIVFDHNPVLGELGTCQYLGEAGAPCAEGADCASGECVEDVCS